MYISQVDIEDRLVWGPTKSREYSVKLGYRQALIRQFPDYYRLDSDWEVWKRLWKFKIPPKWILFVWKCLHNILPVKRELEKRGLTIDPICSSCFQHEESIEHLFFDCPISQRVQQIRNSEILIHSIALLWAIWLQRNSVEFDGVDVSIERTIMAANELLSLLLSPQHNVFCELSYSGIFSQHRIANQVILQNVTTPTAAVPHMRIVVDGPWLSVGNRTGLAWVCFDTDNQRVYEEAILGPPMLSPQQTEAVAVLKALRWAYHYGITSLLLQTDCLVLVLLFQSYDQDHDWSFQSILADILYYCKLFHYVVLEKVERDVVQEAHHLAATVRYSV
ncbi:uncharacterized protein LOC114269111 [Camellia sinensis]|uniref:uncharacterized protein LOC114269111 n=1 Tax=Camellia sinensis TaxID=4442 RepID=UPI0010366BF0|nr:uncharacterized protein LOC114269111 [Camellia sinensis]